MSNGCAKGPAGMSLARSPAMLKRTTVALCAAALGIRGTAIDPLKTIRILAMKP